jgi:hypothetical protein
MTLELFVSRTRLELERAKALVVRAWAALCVRLPFRSSPANDNRKRWGRE